jgi:hypothetical protein
MRVKFQPKRKANACLSSPGRARYFFLLAASNNGSADAFVRGANSAADRPSSCNPTNTSNGTSSQSPHSQSPHRPDVRTFMRVDADGLTAQFGGAPIDPRGDLPPIGGHEFLERRLRLGHALPRRHAWVLRVHVVVAPLQLFLSGWQLDGSSSHPRRRGGDASNRRRPKGVMLAASVGHGNKSRTSTSSRSTDRRTSPKHDQG